MNAGRELDALIAERVMGWKIWKYLGPMGPTQRLAPPKLTFSLKPGAINEIPEIPSYSTDIAAAWLVVEKIRSLPRLADTGTKNDFNLNQMDRLCGGLWVVKSDSIDKYGHLISSHTESPSAPHAICLAALKAVDG